MKHCRPITALLFLLSTLPAFGQGAVLQGGGRTAGHVPMYVGTGTGGQTTVQDSGPASGGAVGLGLSELLMTKRGTGTPPYANGGTGPFGTTNCMYDAPTTNATGYHYLCLDPNAQGGGLLAYGAGGVASPLQLSFNINGTAYQFPFVSSGAVGPSTTVVGDIAIWNNTVGTLLGRVPDVAVGQPLISGGVGASPLYSGAFANFNSSSKFLTLSRNTTAWAPLGTTVLHLKGGDTGEGRFEITSSNSDSVGVFGRMNGTFAAPTHVLANDQIMGLVGVGIDTDASTTMQQGGAIGGFASQDWTSTHHGYYFQFYGINDSTVDLVNYGTLKNQRAGFGTETNPQYGVTFSKNATAGIADPFGNDSLGLIGADSGGAVGFALQAFGSNPVVTIFRANNTNASKTALSSGNIIGGYFGFGYAGSTSSYNGGAGIQMTANQAFSTGNAGTRLEVLTTPNASIASAITATFASSGCFSVGTTADCGAGAIIIKKQLFSALTACSSTIEGAMAAVTDSSTNTWGATITGSSTNHVLAYCDGTNWTVSAK